MSYGVCNCVCGPPAFGVCSACGAVGAGASPPQRMPLTPGVIQTPGITPERVREIIREELDRDRKKRK